MSKELLTCIMHLYHYYRYELRTGINKTFIDNLYASLCDDKAIYRMQSYIMYIYTKDIG
jgi:hypothetical protein